MAYNIQLLASFLLVDLIQSFVLHCAAAAPCSSSHAAAKPKQQPHSAIADPVQSNAAKDEEAEPATCAPLVTGLDSELLDAVNQNGLLYFLLANLLTGGVNFSMETIHAGPQTAYTVLVCYLLTVCGTAAWLHAHRVKVKYW